MRTSHSRHEVQNRRSVHGYSRAPNLSQEGCPDRHCSDHQCKWREGSGRVRPDPSLSLPHAALLVLQRM